MDPIVKRQDQELVNVIRNAAIKLFDAENGPNVRAALDELERRHCNQGSVLARLARVEEDLAAFKREHATHSHEVRPFAQHTLAPTKGVQAPTAEQLDGPNPWGGMRTNAENRAWCLIEEWQAHTGSISDFEVVLSRMADGAHVASMWWHDRQCATKRGTSRVDALAHLASWCQAEMPLQPVPCCQHEGPCGVGVPKCVQETVSLVEVGVPSTEHPHKVAKYTP